MYPDFLPTLLARAGQVITDEAVDWQITEGDYPYLCTDIDSPNTLVLSHAL